MHDLVQQGDYWILAVSVLSVLFFAERIFLKYTALCLIISSAIIYMHYGLLRFLLHVCIFIVSVYVLQNAIEYLFNPDKHLHFLANVILSYSYE